MTTRFTAAATAALFAAAALLLAAYFVRVQAVHPGVGFETEGFYSPLAHNVLHHGVYGFGTPPDVKPTTFRPPFYALTLAAVYGLFGEREVHGVALNTVLMFLTVVLTYVAGRRFGMPVALLGAALFAADPMTVVLANSNQSDALFTLLVALFLVVALRCYGPEVRARDVALASALLVTAALARAVAVYLWVPVVVSLLLAHRFVIRTVPARRLAALAVLFAVIQLAGLGAWMARNYAVSGNADFAGMKAAHLHSFYAPLIVARAHGVSRNAAKAMLLDDLRRDPVFARLGDVEKDLYRKEKAIQIILAHPGSALMVLLGNIPRMFLGYPVESFAVFAPLSEQPAIRDFMRQYATAGLAPSAMVRFFVDHDRMGWLAHAFAAKGYLLLVMLGGAAGLVTLALAPASRARAFLLVAFVGYMVAVSSPATAGRFRTPIMPVMSVAAAAALLATWRAWQTTAERRVAASAHAASAGMGER